MNPDLNFIHSQFPAFSGPSLNGWAFFENAGGSNPCRQFKERLTDFYTKNKVLPYYPYPASSHTGELMDASYKKIAEYLMLKILKFISDLPQHKISMCCQTPCDQCGRTVTK